jgi:hypothetical protein
MLNLFSQGWLLAELDRFSSMGRNFRGEEAQVNSYDVISGLVFVLSMVLGIWLLSRALTRQERSRSFNNPRKLFRMLCDQHELTRANRNLLKAYASRRGLTDPSNLFLSPELFRDSELPEDWRRSAAALATLGQKLFADLDQARQASTGTERSTSNSATRNQEKAATARSA